MVNLIWFITETYSLCQHYATWELKSGVFQARNSTITQALCAGAMFCSNM